MKRRHQMSGSTFSQYTLDQKRRCLVLLHDLGGLTYEGIMACREVCPGIKQKELKDWMEGTSPVVPPEPKQPPPPVAPQPKPNKTRTSKINPHANKYDEEDQKRAVALLAQYGGGLNNEGLTAAQERFPGVGRATLGRWWNRWSEEVVPKSLEIVVDDPKSIMAYESVDEKMFGVLNQALDHIRSSEAMSKASAKDAALVAAIMTDKLMLRVGLSPELLTKLKRFVVVLSRKGYNPLTFLDDLIESYEMEPDAPQS